MTPDFDQTVDARGLLCPLPVLRARKRLLAMREGEVLRIEATDPAAVIDMPHFALGAGHRLLAQEPGEAGVTRYYIARGPDRPELPET